MPNLSQGAALLSTQPPHLDNDFARAVIAGLSRTRKSLPCRYFYDARGSELFEEITRLPEYYPTRTEAQILSTHAGEMTEALCDDGLLIEFGSGSSLKTEILLDRIGPRVAYVPVDVSESALSQAKRRLQQRYPALDVRPIVGDFSQPFALPAEFEGRQRLGFFPGSTIGNLAPDDAATLLNAFRSALGANGRLIIGVDLKKDPRKLVLAYNDAAGVTAAFNLNLLVRINRELDADFDVAAFRHEAIYDPREGRIEMHLVSAQTQDVNIGGLGFKFLRGESVHTENSYKYSVEQFQHLARRAGWQASHVWTDAERQFSVHVLRGVV